MIANDVSSLLREVFRLWAVIRGGCSYRALPRRFGSATMPRGKSLSQGSCPGTFGVGAFRHGWFLASRITLLFLNGRLIKEKEVNRSAKIKPGASAF